MTNRTKTLRPGLLVMLKTATSGNVSYDKSIIQSAHKTDDGKMKAKWETERTISDPVEFEEATKVRMKARSLITSVCYNTAFGLMCPEDNKPQLEKAINDAQKLASDFNANAGMTRISVYALCGKIEADEVQAIRAINSEVRDLLSAMEEGIKNCDVDAVRKAANKAREVGAMLQPEAAAKVQIAIDAARSVARKMTQAAKAGEQAAAEIDLAAIRRITEQRTMFLDLSDQKEIESPSIAGRAVDLAPEETEIKVSAPRAPAVEVD